MGPSYRHNFLGHVFVIFNHPFSQSIISAFRHLKFMLKEFQFIMTLKIWRRTAYTVYHALIQMTSY